MPLHYVAALFPDNHLIQKFQTLYKPVAKYTGTEKRRLDTNIR